MAVREQMESVAREVVERLFLRTKIRMGLVKAPKGDKRLYVTVDPKLTIPTIYEHAARGSGLIPKPSRFASLRKIAQGYLDAQKEAAVAAVTRVVGGAVYAADIGSRFVPDQIRKDLKVQLEEVLDRLRPAIERIVSTEAIVARNVAGIEAVQHVGKSLGQADPLCYFVVIRDGEACKECIRVHLLPNKVTPRVFKVSEIQQVGYHRKGDDRPCTGGLHPHCRCTPQPLAPGFGFDDGGMIKFVAPGHDELAKQRGG